MSIREDMEKATQEIVAEGHDMDARIVAHAKKYFSNVLEDCKQTKESVQSVTEDTLAGIEAGLESTGLKSQEILQRVSRDIVDITKQSAEKSIKKARKDADTSKVALNTEFDKVSGGFDEVIGKTRDEMEAAYFKLHKVTESEVARLQEVSEAIKRYAQHKTYTKLEEVAGKSKEAVHKIETSAKEHRSKLLYHSEKKTAEWLNKLAGKIDRK